MKLNGHKDADNRLPLRPPSTVEQPVELHRICSILVSSINLVIIKVRVRDCLPARYPFIGTILFLRRITCDVIFYVFIFFNSRWICGYINELIAFIESRYYILEIW